MVSRSPRRAEMMRVLVRLSAMMSGGRSASPVAVGTPGAAGTPGRGAVGATGVTLVGVRAPTAREEVVEDLRDLRGVRVADRDDAHLVGRRLDVEGAHDLEQAADVAGRVGQQQQAPVHHDVAALDERADRPRDPLGRDVDHRHDLGDHLVVPPPGVGLGPDDRRERPLARGGERDDLVEVPRAHGGDAVHLEHRQQHVEDLVLRDAPRRLHRDLLARHAGADGVVEPHDLAGRLDDGFDVGVVEVQDDLPATRRRRRDRRARRGPGRSAAAPRSPAWPERVALPGPGLRRAARRAGRGAPARGAPEGAGAGGRDCSGGGLTTRLSRPPQAATMTARRSATPQAEPLTSRSPPRRLRLRRDGHRARRYRADRAPPRNDGERPLGGAGRPERRLPGEDGLTRDRGHPGHSLGARHARLGEPGSLRRHGGHRGLGRRRRLRLRRVAEQHVVDVGPAPQRHAIVGDLLDAVVRQRVADLVAEDPLRLRVPQVRARAAVGADDHPVEAGLLDRPHGHPGGGDRGRGRPGRLGGGLGASRAEEVALRDDGVGRRGRSGRPGRRGGRGRLGGRRGCRGWRRRGRRGSVQIRCSWSPRAAAPASSSTSSTTSSFFSMWRQAPGARRGSVRPRGSASPVPVAM